MRFLVHRVPSIPEIVTCPGDRFQVTFNPSFNGSEIVLNKSGTFDLQERINSFAPYCDIRYMLTQLRLGDRSVVSNRPVVFGDFSSFPDHPVDALNLISDVERSFDSLPEDVKASCNNDWRVYFVRLFDFSRSVSADVPDNGSTSDSATDVKE